MGRTDAHQSSGDSRGQSSVIGVVLIIAIIIAGTTLVVALGSEAFGSTMNQLSGERAEKSMTQLDSQAAMVALGSSQAQEVALASSTNSGYRVEDDGSWMRLSYTNLSGASETTIMNETMGALVYDDGEREIAYQGGGVWRSAGENSTVMVSPPEFHYREATLTLPLVTVSGEDSIDGKAVITQNNSEAYFPNETLNQNFTNPLRRSEVEVTVQSDYYRAWGSFFEQRTTGAVSYDHANNRVNVVLVAPLESTTINAAAASLAPSGSFEVKGSSKVSCSSVSKIYTDSYNSSGTSDGYCDQSPGDQGDVVYGQSIDISTGSGNSDFEGDLVSGGSVAVGNGGGKPDVSGDINYTTSCSPSVSDCQSRINTGSGSVNQIDGIPDRGALNYLVQETVNSTESANANGGTTSITGDSLNYGGSSVTVGAGTYYLDRIDASGKKIILDTTSGNITLAVHEFVHLQNSNMTVKGDGVVYIYVEGAGTHAEDLHVDRDSKVWNKGDDSTQLRVLGQSNFTAVIGKDSGTGATPSLAPGGGAPLGQSTGGDHRFFSVRPASLALAPPGGNLAQFVGVIYAPPGNGGTGNVNVNFGEVYGGIVTGTTTINKGSIHYDEALREKQTVTRGKNVVEVTYLHVSANRVNVTSG